MASSARRRKTAWARTVRAATHSSCRSVAWSPSPSAPSRAAAALEILRRKPAAFGSQAPVVSATRGKNSTPCPRHAAAVSKWAALVSAYAEAAARLVRAASPKVSCREGAVTARSKAVGEPRYEGTYKSAGRRRMLLESSGCWGSRSPPFSFSGCNPARSTQVARMSRSAWWRTVRSPPAQHTAAWRDNVSNMHPITARAPSFRAGVSHAQPLPKLCDKNRRLHPSFARRRRCKESTGPRFSLGPQNSLANNAS